ncbi:hypothetical protein EV421DRAFT_1739447 [Armillaria borealis]|uniref:Uncharacterized protein n=1 Tax=Armillaria borealis TaxID=47425 RepID=A0AA39J608_9AGAR|nr:hypothetical protein EV421DRAFT_1739447 [Armillaria borealis]
MASPALGKTLGAVYIGATIAAILFGITILQTAIYYQRFRKDWILDALHVALSTHALYFYLVENFGNLEVLNEVVWSFKLQLLFDACKLYMPYACADFSGTPLPSGRSVFCGACRVWGIRCLLRHIRDKRVFGYFVHLEYEQTTIIAAFSATTAVDFIISALMCYYLQHDHDAVGLDATRFDFGTCYKHMLVDYTHYGMSVPRSLPSASSKPYAKFLTLPDSLVFLGFNFVLPKPMLNARKELRELPTENASDGETLLTALRFNKNFGDSTGDQSSRQIESEDVEPGTMTVSR